MKKIILFLICYTAIAAISCVIIRREKSTNGTAFMPLQGGNIEASRNPLCTETAIVIDSLIIK